MFVKICGITSEEDALLAVAMGADALGFVMAPGSRRLIRPDAVRDIIKRLPPETVTVGVFRDERPERLVEIVHHVGLTGAQLHGREPLSEVRWVRQRVKFVIQAFAAGDPALSAAANGPADVILVDSPDPGLGPPLRLEARRRRARRHPADARGRAVAGQRGRGDPTGPALGRRRVERGRGVARARRTPRKLRRFIQTAHEAGEALADDERPQAASPDGPFDWQVDELT